MSREYILWISLFAYACHIYEEKMLDWKSWGEQILGIKGLEWSDFYVANAAVIVTGACAATVGWHVTAFALILPALQLINGIFFHIIPTIVKGRFSPGVITSVILFLPISLWAYYGAYKDGALSNVSIPLSLLFAACIMASPFLLLKIKAKIKS